MTNLSSSSEINVLMVEDNPIDARLIKMALKEGGFTKEPTILDDGLPALALLRGDKEYAGFPRPDLVILDLNLKQVDGPKVLAYIRQTADLRNLCVAILSSSPTEVMLSRAAEANGYFTKPHDLNGFKILGSQIMNCYCGYCGDLRK
jgi:CheY-like chemotaxis protein